MLPVVWIDMRDHLNHLLSVWVIYFFNTSQQNVMFQCFQVPNHTYRKHARMRSYNTCAYKTIELLMLLVWSVVLPYASIDARSE